MPFDDDRLLLDNFAPTEIIPGLMAPQTVQMPRVEDDEPEPVTEFFGPIPRAADDPQTTAFERPSASETVPDRPTVSKPVKGRHRVSTAPQEPRKAKVRSAPAAGSWGRVLRDMLHDPNSVYYLLLIAVGSLVVFWWTLVSFKPEWVPPMINPRTATHSPSVQPTDRIPVDVPVRQPRTTQSGDPRPRHTRLHPVVPKPSPSGSRTPSASHSPASPEPSASITPSPSAPVSESPRPSGTPAPVENTQSPGGSHGPGSTKEPVSQSPQSPQGASPTVEQSSAASPAPEPTGSVGQSPA